MKYALVGPGRMGREIAAVAEARGHSCVASVGRPAPGCCGGIDVAALAGAEVVFEFTRPEAAAANLRQLAAAGFAVVCGTTGWQLDSELEQWLERSGSAVVLAPNFSVGVNLFLRIVEHAAGLLAPAGLYEPFVLEHHHRAKLDAPSGTARRLVQIVERHRPQEPAPQAIQVASVRAGHEPGMHRVGFEGPTDSIVLEHRARSREGFALGAVLAAEWVRGKTGVFRFEDQLAEIVERKKESP